MLSDATLKNIISAVNKANFWACSPCKWDARNRKIILVNRGARKFLWYFNILAQILYEVYVIFQCVITFLDKKSTPQNKIYMQYVAIAYMIPLIFHAGIAFRLTEIPEFVAQYIDFFQDYSGNKFMVFKRLK